MNAEMIAALRELEREKGIAFETILQGLEEAMASAYKTWWKQENRTRTTTSWASVPRSTPRAATCACGSRTSRRSRCHRSRKAPSRRSR